MKTAACCRKANSSSVEMLSLFDGVAVNFSDGNIQLNLAFGRAGPEEVDDVACMLYSK